MNKRKKAMLDHPEPFMRMVGVLNKKERIEWNNRRAELWDLADRLLDEQRMREGPDSDCKGSAIAQRLKDLIRQIPIFFDDGYAVSHRKE